MSVTYNHIELAPLATSVGVEISGVDLAEPPGGAEVAEIRRVLGEYGVVFFRDQRLTPEQHIAFARCYVGLQAAHPGFMRHTEHRFADNFTEKQ
jgi:alpha-ketoglutarate-dependent taurine dioxygenase